MAFDNPAQFTSWPVSDHYDGERFFNPTLPKDFMSSPASAFRMIREKRIKWPSSVENEGVPRLHEVLGPGEMAVTFIGHATFLLQLPGLNILTDPVWSERASPVSWTGPRRVRAPGVRFDDLPHIDLILISHNHFDHLDLPTLRRLGARFAPRVLVAAGDKRLVETTGLRDVVELDWWQRADAGGGAAAVFAPVQHLSGRSLGGRGRSLWGSFMIEGDMGRVFFGGDAGYSRHYADIRQRLGAPDIALLGIGAYAPRWFMQPMHMDSAEAVRAHLDLGAGQSIGMHFGTFRLSAGSEAFWQPQEDLKRAVAAADLPAGGFITLQEGETRLYPAKRPGEGA